MLFDNKIDPNNKTQTQFNQTNYNSRTQSNFNQTKFTSNKTMTKFNQTNYTNNKTNTKWNNNKNNDEMNNTAGTNYNTTESDMTTKAITSLNNTKQQFHNFGKPNKTGKNIIIKSPKKAEKKRKKIREQEGN